MSRPHTKLNPTAPSFPHTETQTPVPVEAPQASQSDQYIDEAEEDDVKGHTLDPTKLPEWMLVDENEHFRVVALRLVKADSPEEWLARAREFVGLTFPGCTITTPKNDLWIPLAVRQMPPALKPELPPESVTFSMNFLQDELRGALWSPGFYFIHPDNRPEGSKVTAYWLLENKMDPFLPTAPGEHGAKLTPFFNTTFSKPGAAPTEEDYMNAPVFIAKTAGCEYEYFGQYSQTRYSDKLDFERIADGTVLPFVLDTWAKYLTLNSQKHLPAWTKDALREHIWPKPVYTGPTSLEPAMSSHDTNGSQTLASDDSEAHKKRVRTEIERHAEDLHKWEIESRLKLSMLKESDIHRLFHAADADEQPGLRLWFEYLECNSYDSEFYERLVEIKNNERLQRGHEARKQERLRQGWTWELVSKVAGSGHEHTVLQLCPPKARAPVARRDSFTSVAQGLPSSKGDAEEEGSVAPSTRGRTLRRQDSEETVKASAEEQQQTEKVVQRAKDLQRDDGGKIVKGEIEEVQMLPPQQRKALPPHLRAKAAKQASGGADKDVAANTPTKIRQSAAVHDDRKSETTARDLSAAGKEAPSVKDREVGEKSQNSNASAFATGDLDAAKEMQSQFTRAKRRRAGYASAWGFDSKGEHGP